MAYPMQRLPTTWQPSQTEFAEKPWKYIGYRFFSSLVASDDDSFVLRRFSTLTARVLLGLQDQLSRVEEDLEEVEKRAREQDAPDVHNGSFRLETQEYRRDLVRQAQLLLREYSQLAFLYGSPIKGHLCDCVPQEWNNARQIDIDTAYATSYLILPSSRPLTFTLQMNSLSSIPKSEHGHRSQKETSVISMAGSTTTKMQSWPKRQTTSSILLISSLSCHE